MTEPTQTTTPPPQTTTTPPSPKPGWKTTEAWITLIVIILGALPSSGLLPQTGDAVKIVGLILTVAAALGYTGSRTMLKNVSMLFLIVFLAHTATGCVSAREKTINTTLAGLQSAEVGFESFDAQHQLDLVNDSPDRAEADARLAAYRAKRDKVRAGFTAAYRATAVAATVDSDQSLSAMVQAAMVIGQELKDLGVTP